MRVKVTTWRGEGAMDLSDVLRPTGDGEGGAAERTQSQAYVNSEVIGRIAALLVDRQIITLDEAVTACGIFQYDTITPVEDE